MTIDEAIKHCEDVVELNEMYCDTTDSDRIKCAADHRQLAEWLTELKELREEKEIALSVRTGAKAKYNYTDEQVIAYWQGVEDCAKDTIDKRQKCDLDILRGINGIAVGINNYRVTDGKIYGMLVTEGHFKLNCYDVIHAICKERSADEALKLIGGSEMADYISRDDVRRFIADAFSENRFATNYDYAILVDKIDEIPSTDVQPVKRGKWDGYICSECNVCADYFISGDFYFDEKPDYCPNCGARMDGDVE